MTGMEASSSSSASTKAAAGVELSEVEQDVLRFALYNTVSSDLRVSVRCNDLPSCSWLREASTFVALFTQPPAAAGASRSHSLQLRALPRFIAHTEAAAESNAPTFRTMLNIPQGEDNATCILRVYPADQDVVDEERYMAEAAFNTAELLDNARAGIVSVILPLVHSTNPALNDALKSSHASITLTLHLSAADINAQTPSAVLSHTAYLFTPFNTHATPSASTRFELSATLENKNDSNRDSNHLVSVWYRPSCAESFRFLSLLDPTCSYSQLLMLSDAMNNGSASEFRFVAHPPSILRASPPTSLIARRSTRNIARALDSPHLQSSMITSVNVSLTQLLTARDSVEGLSLPLGHSSTSSATGDMKLRVHVRAWKRGNSTQTLKSAASLTLSSLPPTLLNKSHALLRQGMQFIAHELPQDGASAGVASPHTIMLRLTDDDSPRLCWCHAGAIEGSIELSAITHVYGGAANSDTLQHAESSGKLSAAAIASSFTLLTRAGERLSLQSSHSSARDTFVAALLASQRQSPSIDIAQWHPAVVPPAEQKMKLTLKYRAAPSSSRTSPSSPRSPFVVDEVTAQLAKEFESGCNFLRYTTVAPRPFHISLFLRRDEREKASSGAPVYWLYWYRADARHVSPSRSMRCDEIVGVALGKQTTVFRDEAAALAPAQHCFSIVARTQSLHLQCCSSKDAETFARNLIAICKHYTPQPKLWQAGTHTDPLCRTEVENTSEQQEENDGFTAVEPAALPRLAHAYGYRCDIDLSVRCRGLPSKHANHVVCAFDMQHDEEEDTDRLVYLAQTERQTRSTNVDFRQSFHLPFLSTHPRRLRLNVYDLPTHAQSIDESERIGSAVVHLHQIVDGDGMEFVYKLTHETHTKHAALTKNGATLIVQCIRKTEMIME